MKTADEEWADLEQERATIKTAYRPMHQGCRDEGKAACVMGYPDKMNPYRSEIRRLARQEEATDAPSILYEQAAAWDCGFAWGGYKFPT